MAGNNTHIYRIVQIGGISYSIKSLKAKINETYTHFITNMNNYLILF
jgi:hypothetical protein